MADSVSPSNATCPRCITTVRGQRMWMACMEWVTKTMVVPDRWRFRMRSKHRSWKPVSPTASTSSTRRMSGSTWMATAKPSRMNIPDE
jgi:hypothetical protein